MRLNRQSISGENRLPWIENGFLLPEFDIEQVRKETTENPDWIHFGAGNIFRAFPAAVAQNLLERGEMKKGIVAVSGFSNEPIDRTYTPYDNLSVLVTMKADGSLVVLGLLRQQAAGGFCMAGRSISKRQPADGQYHHYGEGL